MLQPHPTFETKQKTSMSKYRFVGEEVGQTGSGFRVLFEAKRKDFSYGDVIDIGICCLPDFP